jgi:hypothetical protein
MRIKLANITPWGYGFRAVTNPSSVQEIVGLPQFFYRFSRFFNALVGPMCISVTASGTLQVAASMGCLRGICVGDRLQAQSWQGNS